MKSNNSGGKIFFFKTDKTPNPKDCFTPLLEVNSNFDNLKTLSLTNGKAYGITINNELLEWEFEKKKTNKNIPISPQENAENASNITPSKAQNKKNDFYFLLSKPSYRFHKQKIKSISLNKTMCLSLDINGNVLVWGQSKDGLLGLGYDVNSVDNPTLLDGLVDIVDISLSDYHAVALNSSGIPFSWGLGKYGELGLERSIYSPVPQQMNTEGLYSRVFCGNLITCFLDFEGHFSYFGVIIKQLGGNSSTVTTKNLLNDQNIDSKSIFLEKEFEELEDQKFKEIVIGNGFIGLLGTTGTLFTLEYNDKLTMLYSKYYLYNIVVVKNGIFGLAKDNVKIMENKNNLNENILLNSNEEKIKTNYYLCKWSSKSSSENEVCSDIWTTTIWKFKDEFTNVIENSKLLDTNDNRNILLLLDMDEKYATNLNTSVLNPNKKLLDLSNNNELLQLDMSMNNNTTIAENIMMFNLNKKKLPEKFLIYEAEFDDSFNLKYKRTKAKSRSILKDLPYLGTIRSRSQSRFLNKSYNGSFQNSAYNLNKSNFVNFGNNNISAIGLNTSGFTNKKSFLIPTSNNYKKANGKIITNNLRNYNNSLNQKNNNKYKNNNLDKNSKNSMSFNYNDLSKDNNEYDNNYNENINNNNSFKKNTKEKEKDNDNVNIYEEPVDVKERELNKYRSEIDDIIANYKNKQHIKKNNLMNKYGLSRENNINLINQNKRENEINYMDNQNSSRDNIINFNIKEQIENSNNKSKDNESPSKLSSNKRYEAENENNNITGKKEKSQNHNLYNKIIQSTNKKSENDNKIIQNIQHYFKNNKVNSQKRNKRKNIKKNKSENEIEFDLNRQETFQNINNNRGEYNSLIINNPLSLFITNSELSELVPTKCLSEGNDILNNENEEYDNEKNNKDKNKVEYNNNLFIKQNKNKNDNLIDKNGNNKYNDDQLISSPAFYKGDNQKNRVSYLNKNETKNNTSPKVENFSINFKDNNKNREINNNKNNNLAVKNTIYTKKNQNNKTAGTDDYDKTNSNTGQKIKGTNLLITQNINNINIISEKKPKDINNENQINNNNETKDLKNNKIKIPKNTTSIKIGNKNINNIDQYKNNNNIKISQGPKNAIKISKMNTKKTTNLNNKSNNNEKNNMKLRRDKNNEFNIKGNIQLNKDNNINTSKDNKEQNYMNLPIKLEDVEKRNMKNYQKQNLEGYNFEDFNEVKNNKQDNQYIDREPDLNNCDFDENDINDNENDNENEKNNKKNNKIIIQNYQKENIYSYKYADNNKNKINNNYSIENNTNNINIQEKNLQNDNESQSANSQINKSSISYFCYLMKNYMQKKCYKMCAYEIANFQKKYEKSLSLKLLFMVIKKRIIFYKIKFFHRYKKIYKYLLKYKKTKNEIKSGESSQRSNQYNTKGNKK